MIIKRAVSQEPNHDRFFKERVICVHLLEMQNLRPDPLNQNVKFHVIPRWFPLHTNQKHSPVSSASPAPSPFLARFLAMLPLAPALQPLHPRSGLFPECTSHAPSSGLCIRCSFCRKCASSGYLQGSLFRILLRVTLSDRPLSITFSNRATLFPNSLSPYPALYCTADKLYIYFSCLSILECKTHESRDLILSPKGVPGSSQPSIKYLLNE